MFLRSNPFRKMKFLKYFFEILAPFHVIIKTLLKVSDPVLGKIPQLVNNIKKVHFKKTRHLDFWTSLNLQESVESK